MSLSSKVTTATGQVMVYVEENLDSGGELGEALVCKPLFTYKALQQGSYGQLTSKTVYKDYLLSSEAFLLP